MSQHLLEHFYREIDQQSMYQQCYNIVEVNHLKFIGIEKEALTLKLNLLLNLYSSFCIPFVIFILRFVRIIINYLFSVNISNF